MDMKKLIDDADFDNLNELTRRWKKDPAPTASLADSQFSLPPAPAPRAPNKENQLAQSNVVEVVVERKRGSAPQVMDEDTEHFRNRLEHLLNGFKTDAVGEFMAMKRSMLDCQKETIRGDTQKYLTMYEEKHQELLKAKDQIITLSTDLERKTLQVELMSAHIAKLNQKVRITQFLSRPFALLFQNKEREKTLKFKMAQAAAHDNRRLKIKSVNGWRNVWRELKKEQEEESSNKRIEMEVNDIVSRFQKEMEMLKEKLAEATRRNEQYENNKQLIQDNLKKAFLRGISSMNMEAIGIFGEQQQPQSDLGFSRATQPQLPSHSLNQSSLNPMASSQTSLIVGRPKIESKDHKWKQAPILGMEEKMEVEEPRPQLVRPTTEAKVIRVYEGKSSVEAVPSREMPAKRTTNPNPSAVKSQATRTEAGSRKKM